MKSYPIEVTSETTRADTTTERSSTFSAGPAERGPLFSPVHCSTRSEVESIFGSSSFSSVRAASKCTSVSDSSVGIIRVENQEDFYSDAIQINVSGKPAALILSKSSIQNVSVASGGPNLFTLSVNGQETSNMSFDSKRPKAYLKELHTDELYTWVYNSANLPPDLSGSSLSTSIINDAVTIAKSKVSRPRTPWVVNSKNERLFRFELGYESLDANSKYKITIENITESTFDVALREPGQRGNNFVEVYRGLSLDRSSDRYIEKVIGSSRSKYKGDGSFRTMQGYAGGSSKVFVDVIDNPRPGAPVGYEGVFTHLVDWAPSPVIKSNYNRSEGYWRANEYGLTKDEFSEYEKEEFLGFSFDSTVNDNFLSNPQGQRTSEFSFPFDPLTQPLWKRKFQIPFQNGWPGHGPFNKKELNISGVEELKTVLRNTAPSFNINSLFVSTIDLASKSEASIALAKFASKNSLDFIWIAPLILNNDKKIENIELESILSLYNSTNIAAYFGVVNNSQTLAEHVLSVYHENDSRQRNSTAQSGPKTGSLRDVESIKHISVKDAEVLKNYKINFCDSGPTGPHLLGDFTFTKSTDPFSSLRIKRSVIWLSSQIRQRISENLFEQSSIEVKRALESEIIELLEGPEISSSIEYYRGPSVVVENHNIDVAIDIKFFNTIDSVSISFTVTDN